MISESKSRCEVTVEERTSIGEEFMMLVQEVNLDSFPMR